MIITKQVRDMKVGDTVEWVREWKVSIIEKVNYHVDDEYLMVMQSTTEPAEEWRNVVRGGMSWHVSVPDTEWVSAIAYDLKVGDRFKYEDRSVFDKVYTVEQHEDLAAVHKEGETRYRHAIAGSRKVLVERPKLSEANTRGRTIDDAIKEAVKALIATMRNVGVSTSDTVGKDTRKMFNLYLAE